MNDQTTKLIEQLAQKLGTTAQYMWSVLIKQASIAAITDILMICLTILFCVAVLFAHKYFNKPRGEYGNSIYYEKDGLYIGMALTAGTALVLFAASLFLIPDIISGFFNPEYWALHEILTNIKN